MDMIIKNGTVVNASGSFRADVGVKDGKIVCIADSIEPNGCQSIVDASGKLVLPGAIDAHTHLAMPFGGTVSSDDYFAGTRAAACGGTTMVFDFALQDFGEKMTDKHYYRHSGFPGGLTDLTLAEVVEKDPTLAIEQAVKGMLPKGPLGREMITKLHVYAGPDHNHAAQKPEVLTF